MIIQASLFARKCQHPLAALRSTLVVIVTFRLTGGSLWLRHFSHSQFSIQHGDPNLNEQVRTLICPTHLPLLCAPQAHHFIDRRFRNAAADWHASPIAPSIIHQVPAIGLEVPVCPTKIPIQRRIRRMVRRFLDHVVYALDPFDSFATLAVPCQPLCGCDFVLHRAPIWR